jgi:hypothetical protein
VNLGGQIWNIGGSTSCRVMVDARWMVCTLFNGVLDRRSQWSPLSQLGLLTYTPVRTPQAWLRKLAPATCTSDKRQTLSAQTRKSAVNAHNVIRSPGYCSSA